MNIFSIFYVCDSVSVKCSRKESIVKCALCVVAWSAGIGVRKGISRFHRIKVPAAKLFHVPSNCGHGLNLRKVFFADRTICIYLLSRATAHLEHYTFQDHSEIIVARCDGGFALEIINSYAFVTGSLERRNYAREKYVTQFVSAPALLYRRTNTFARHRLYTL